MLNFGEFESREGTKINFHFANENIRNKLGIKFSRRDIQQKINRFVEYYELFRKDSVEIYIDEDGMFCTKEEFELGKDTDKSEKVNTVMNVYIVLPFDTKG